MITGATLFTGGGGADIAMENAGIMPLWGIEYDDDIASVARLNGIPVTTADLLDCSPCDFPRVDVLHASPPCPNFSIAKAGAEETELDISLAEKVAEFIRVIAPNYFTLENVYMYRKSKSWQIILRTLLDSGYCVRYEHVNFANLGVPQTRKRMIVRAIRDAEYVPVLRYTHEKEQLPLFGLQPWRGWHEAVEDLIPTFEETSFADWQLARMPDEMKNSFLVSNAGNTSFNDAFAGRGFIDGGNPCATVTKSGYRAFIVDGSGNDGMRSVTVREDGLPVFTLTASLWKRPLRLSNGGRVVALNTRALARLQSFPDTYQLPDSKKLSCRIIGNAVPPIGMAEIYRQLIGGDAKTKRG